MGFNASNVDFLSQKNFDESETQVVGDHKYMGEIEPLQAYKNTQFNAVVKHDQKALISSDSIVPTPHEYEAQPEMSESDDEEEDDEEDILPVTYL